MKLQEKYNQKQEEIRHQLLILMDKMDKHQKGQTQDSRNWGYFGDLEFVNDKLTEINRFLK